MLWKQWGIKRRMKWLCQNCKIKVDFKFPSLWCLRYTHIRGRCLVLQTGCNSDWSLSSHGPPHLFTGEVTYYVLIGAVPGTFYCDHRNLQLLLNKSQREDSVSEPLEKGDWMSRELACSHVAKKSQLGDFPLHLRSQWRGLGQSLGRELHPTCHN